MDAKVHVTPEKEVENLVQALNQAGAGIAAVQSEVERFMADEVQLAAQRPNLFDHLVGAVRRGAFGRVSIEKLLSTLVEDPRRPNMVGVLGAGLNQAAADLDAMESFVIRFLRDEAGLAAEKPFRFDLLVAARDRANRARADIERVIATLAVVPPKAR